MYKLVNKRTSHSNVNVTGDVSLILSSLTIQTILSTSTFTNFTQLPQLKKKFKITTKWAPCFSTGVISLNSALKSWCSNSIQSNTSQFVHAIKQRNLKNSSLYNINIMQNDLGISFLFSLYQTSIP